MLPADLIRTANLLAKASPNRPIQSNLRRAQSTAYYAIFHALARCAADTLVGTSQEARRSDAWHHVYRSLDHSQALKRCGHVEQFPRRVRQFAGAFVALQQKRELADYDPRKRVTKSEVLIDIKLAEAAIVGLNGVHIDDRRAFAIWVAVKKDRRP